MDTVGVSIIIARALRLTLTIEKTLSASTNDWPHIPVCKGNQRDHFLSRERLLLGLDTFKNCVDPLKAFILDVGRPKYGAAKIHAGWTSKLQSLLEPIQADLEKMNFYIEATQTRPMRYWSAFSGTFESKKRHRSDCKSRRERADLLVQHINSVWTFSALYLQARNQLQGPAVDTMESKKLLEAIRSNQAESDAFYQCWQAQGVTQFIELRVSTTDFDRDEHAFDLTSLFESKKYRMYTASKDSANQSTDWIVEPAAHITSKDAIPQDSAIVSQPKITDFAGLQSLLQVGDCGALCSQDSTHCYSVARKLESTSLCTAVSLRDLLDGRTEKNIQQTHARRLQLAEKFRLAYRITEFGLLFFGTAWISQIQLNSLKMIPDATTSRYILEIQKHDDLLNSSDPSLERQIFRLGGILIEIALGKPSYSARSAKFQSNDGELSNIQRVMGLEYRQACQFCLSKGFDFSASPSESCSDSQSDGTAYTDHKSEVLSGQVNKPMIESSILWKQYYTEVFLRLQELYEIIVNVPTSAH